MKVFIILSLAAAAVAQLAEPQYQPIPYSFNYIAETEDGGSSSRQEEGDGAGRVSGTYTINDLEGHSRIVDYIADEGGFRATIRSNEPGIINESPADVLIESSAPSAGAAAPAPARIYSAPIAAPIARPARPAAAPAPARIYSAPIAAPIARPAQPAPATNIATDNRSGIRYVLVPETDPRAAGGIPI